jgi:hypothetical protein
LPSERACLYVALINEVRALTRFPMRPPQTWSQMSRMPYQPACNDPSYLRPLLDLGRESLSHRLVSGTRLYATLPRLGGLVFDQSGRETIVSSLGLRKGPSHDKKFPRALDRCLCLAYRRAVGDGIYVSDLVRPGERISPGKALYARSGAKVAGQASRGSATINLTHGRAMRERSHGIMTRSPRSALLRKRRRCWSAAATTYVCAGSYEQISILPRQGLRRA